MDDQVRRPRLSAMNQDDYQETEICYMASSEIKKELTLLRVDFSDCFSRAELEDRLQQARSVDREPPNFNKEGNHFHAKFPDEKLEELRTHPELRRLLEDPKVLTMMIDISSGDPEKIERYTSDPESFRLMMDMSALLWKLAPNYRPPLHL